MNFTERFREWKKNRPRIRYWKYYSINLFLTNKNKKLVTASAFVFWTYNSFNPFQHSAAFPTETNVLQNEWAVSLRNATLEWNWSRENQNEENEICSVMKWFSVVVKVCSGKLEWLSDLNPLMPVGNKKGHTHLNKPTGFSMCDLFVTTRH